MTDIYPSPLLANASYRHYFLAECALYAYQEQEVLEAIFPAEQPNSWKFVKFFRATTTSTEAFLVYSRSTREAVLAFRGSQERVDWVNIDYNILFWEDYVDPTPEKRMGGKVASGFYRSWKDIRVQVLEALRLLQEPNLTFYVTGHSLGGALAILASIDIWANVPQSWKLNVYTFGHAPVGNQAFVSLYDSL